MSQKPYAATGRLKECKSGAVANTRFTGRKNECIVRVLAVESLGCHCKGGDQSSRSRQAAGFGPLGQGRPKLVFTVAAAWAVSLHLVKNCRFDRGSPQGVH